MVNFSGEKPAYLAQLSEIVVALTNRSEFAQTVADLKQELRVSPEPFVWASLDLSPFSSCLPKHIQSGWIFVLRPDRWSGAHKHPNSIQHMVMIEGKGQARVGSGLENMVRFGSSSAIEEQWYVIEADEPHEFRPEATEMVVVSFHTCPADELIEVSTATGESRRYFT